jgi:hypothetical protein
VVFGRVKLEALLSHMTEVSPTKHGYSLFLLPTLKINPGKNTNPHAHPNTIHTTANK